MLKPDVGEDFCNPSTLKGRWDRRIARKLAGLA